MVAPDLLIFQAHRARGPPGPFDLDQIRSQFKKVICGIFAEKLRRLHVV
jgi:hypothetical protein